MFITNIFDRGLFLVVLSWYIFDRKLDGNELDKSDT